MSNDNEKSGVIVDIDGKSIERITPGNIQQRPAASNAIAAAADKSATFLSMIERVATNPDADISKMERLYDMYKDMQAEQAKAEYNSAMALVQAEIPAVKKKKKNEQTSSMYAELEDIINAARPIYTQHGFSVSSYEGRATELNPILDGEIRVCADVSHNGGDTRHFEYDVPLDMTGIKGNVNKTKVHAKASSVSYGLRYLLNLIFLIEFEGADDDGNAAGAGIKPGQEYERITDEQALQIESKITDNDLNMEKFIKFLRARYQMGLKAPRDIPASKFKDALSQVEAAIEAHQKKGK